MYNFGLSIKRYAKKYDNFLSLESIKKHLWILGNDEMENKILADLRSCAIDAAESFLCCSLVEQSLSYVVDTYSTAHIVLPIGRVEKINNIIHRSKNNLEYKKDDYCIKDQGVMFINGTFCDQVQIDYTANWCNGDVPSDIKQGILQHISNIYNKQELALSMLSDIRALYQPYRKLLI